MKFLAYLALISISKTSPTQDEAYTSSYEDCLAFAARFDNTCADQTTQVSYANLDTATMTCEQSGSMSQATCQAHGTKDGTTCTFTRKLCVTCTQSANTVTIRAQSNNMPNHCYFSPKDQATEVEVDYSATWLPLSNVDVQDDANVTTQDDVNSLICNILRSADSNIPAESNYVKNSGSAKNTAWGISTTGLLMFSSASAEGVDPFYPSIYGDVTDPDSVVEAVDGCLSHPQAAGIMHYHSASTCVADKDSYENQGPPFTADVVDSITEAFETNLSYRSVFGLAKDGRPVYTPLHSGGIAMDDCDVDVCNGFDLNGHYSYVTTLFHPYIVGCYGPGSMPNYS